MYLTGSKVVLPSAFAAVSYLTSRPSAILRWSVPWIRYRVLVSVDLTRVHNTSDTVESGHYLHVVPTGRFVHTLVS